LCGKQAIDDDYNQTGQMLAGLWGVPQATFISSLKIIDNVAHIVRDIDGGTQNLELDLPALVTVDLRLNTPRYASLPSIMKAKSKPMQTMSLDDLGISVQNRLICTTIQEPAPRKAGVMLTNIDDLITKITEQS